MTCLKLTREEMVHHGYNERVQCRKYNVCPPIYLTEGRAGNHYYDEVENPAESRDNRRSTSSVVKMYW